MTVQSKFFTRLPLEQIRKNPNNFYELNEKERAAKVSALQRSLQTEGQITPIEVVPTGEPDRPYMIISGNTRFEATCRNFEAGIGDGQIDAIINPAEISDDEMFTRLVYANLQREKSIEDWYTEIEIVGKEFDHLKEKGEVSGRRDDYIASRIGICSRTIRNYRKKITEKQEQQALPAENVYSFVSDRDEVKKALESVQRSLKKAEKVADKHHRSELARMMTGLMEVIRDVQY